MHRRENHSVINVWEERYSSAEYIYGTSPSEFLLSLKSPTWAGRKVLALADGEGRNGVWLAAQGLNVVSVDLSRRGIEKAQKLATERGVRLECFQADLLSWDWPTDTFDLVVSSYLQLPEHEMRWIHHRAGDALVRGGVVMIEGFHRDQAFRRGQEPRLAPVYFTCDSLREHFAGFEVQECSRSEVALNHGFMHQGMADVVRFSATKR